MYRKYITTELEKMDDMTFGKAVFAAISARENKSISKSQWLFEVTNEDFYTALKTAQENEREE